MYASYNGTFKETQYYVLEIETAYGTVKSVPIKYGKPMTAPNNPGTPAPIPSTPSAPTPTPVPTPVPTAGKAMKVVGDNTVAYTADGSQGPLLLSSVRQVLT